MMLLMLYSIRFCSQEEGAVQEEVMVSALQPFPEADDPGSRSRQVSAPLPAEPASKSPL